ncbi:3-isopropylmalate dehydratase large subunit [Candidatus Bathyarchaeota archaeon]|nr:3-isopropylmalate dehydratase large subunit [Candidatus Bathyarchaeota archaeon]
MNIVEKILCRVSGKSVVEPGEIIRAKVDRLMFHDLTGPLTVKAFKEIGVSKVWDPDRVVVIFDHLVPPNGERAALNQKIIREFVKEQKIKWFYDIGRGGICHQVMVEKGHAKPGELIIGADSHTCTYGAVGAFSTGMGATDVAAVLATGETWLRVPETVCVKIDGELGDMVTSKDVILYVIGCLGVSGAVYKAVVFKGSTVERMSVSGRMTMCNMAVEMGAKTGIVEPDHVTEQFFKSKNIPYGSGFVSDQNAAFDETYTFDVSKLGPQVACPNSVDNVKPVSEVEGIKVDQAYIGSCTNGRLEDLRLAARIAKGKRVKPDVRAIIVPASQEVYQEALREGLIEVFLQAGVLVCNPTCGACIGAHMGVISEGETCIASINRNFIGRMGSPKAKVYLASPATVMASALTGVITDPRGVAA